MVLGKEVFIHQHKVSSLFISFALNTQQMRLEALTLRLNLLT